MDMWRIAILVTAGLEALVAGLLTWWAISEGGGGLGIAAWLAKVAVSVVALTALPAAMLALAGRLTWLAGVLVSLPILLAAWGRFG